LHSFTLVYVFIMNRIMIYIAQFNTTHVAQSASQSQTKKHTSTHRQ